MTSEDGGRAATPWLPFTRGVSAAPMRLFCFHHAGGAASAFHAWVGAAEVEVCPVQLPGRGTRTREPFGSGIRDLAQPIAEALLPWLDAPFALLGNSMGALVAFEVARFLAHRLGRPPTRLFAAASLAPGEHRLADMTALSDRELAESVGADYDAIPPEVHEHPEFLEFFMPILRADLELVRTYRKPRLPALACPVTAVVGSADRSLAGGAPDGWGAVTTGPFERIVVPGGHFAPLEQRRLFQDLLSPAAH